MAGGHVNRIPGALARELLHIFDGSA